jgi:hypothetical protein
MPKYKDYHYTVKSTPFIEKTGEPPILLWGWIIEDTMQTNVDDLASKEDAMIDVEDAIDEYYN